MEKLKIEDDFLEYMPEDMGEKEIEELWAKLEEFKVPYPSEEKIQSTVMSLSQYVPKKKKAPLRGFDKFISLLICAGKEVSFFSNSYWAISTGLFIFGFIVLLSATISPLVTIIMLAPLPFILGLLEVFKGREEGVMELELACKRSIQEIILSRLTMVGFYNILLNSVLSLAISFIDPNLTLWRIVLTWLTPFTLISGISLGVAAKIRGGNWVTFTIATWVASGMIIFSWPEFQQKLLQVNLGLHIILSLLGTIIILTYLRKVIYKCQLDDEGGESFETNI